MKISNFTRHAAIAMLLLSGAATSQAQTEKSNPFGIANRIGAGLNAGTEGIGFDVAIPLTKYVQASIGMNFFPTISVNETADVTGEVQGVSYSGRMDVKGKVSRTTFDVRFDCYPFANSSSFFIAAGFSVGGKDLMTITGHSDELQQQIAQGRQYGVEIGNYEIPVDENGNVRGGVRVKGFRPYLGLGFGRMIPKKRIGARIELGAQFQGKPVVYADGVGDLTEVLDNEDKDDIAKVLDLLKVYPVLKFSLRGRFL